MGSESIGKLLLRFATPVVIGLVITRFYILIDGMFVGQAVGAVGVAATTIAMPFVTLLSATVMMIGDGGTAVMALRLGARQASNASRVLGNSLFLLLMFAGAIAITAPIFVDCLLLMSGAVGEVYAQARIYLLITAFGTLSLGFSLGIDTFLRAAGFPTRTLLVQMCGALVNIALDYLFVVVLGFGVAGAAFATLLGQVTSMLMTLWLLHGRSMPFRLRVSDLRPSKSLLLRIALLGMPSFIVRGSDAVLNIILNSIIVDYGALTLVGGDNALAVTGAISRISQFALVPAIGIAVGMRPILGYNYGARNIDRVREIVKKAVLAGSFCLLAFWLVVELAPQVLIGPFAFQGETENFALWALRVYLLAMPILMIRISGTNYFQAIGQAKKSIILTFCQQVVLMIPFIVVMPLILPALFGFGQLESVFIGILLSDLVSTALVGVFLWGDSKKSRKA